MQVIAIAQAVGRACRWFEPAGAGSSDGLVVRSNYRLDGPPLSTFDHFGRPYRVAAFMSMLRELR